MECELPEWVQGVGEHNHPARPWIGAPLESTPRWPEGHLPATEACQCPDVFCAAVFLAGRGRSGQNAKVLDRPTGKQLLALAQAICLQRCKEGKGLPEFSWQGRPPDPWSQFLLWSRAVGAMPTVLTLPLLPAGHLRAAGPSMGFCAYLHLLRGKSAPGTSKQPPLGLGLGPNWWW